MKKFIKYLSITAFSALLFTSCSSVYEKVYPALTDGKYDSEFPYNNSSEQLDKISHTIRMVNSIAFYTGYVFGEGTAYTLADIKRIDFETTASKEVYFNRTASGTGTVIYSDPDRIALLTVAHIISFPDTIISFFVDSNGDPTKYVQSVSVKSKQSNYVPDLPRGGSLEIIKMDKVNDIALLGMKINMIDAMNIPKFQYPWGKSSELEWGTFVYVFGFPMNYKMISKGIVSTTGIEKHSFLIDAVFNRGYSGGIVLAVRDGVPNFELVGLVRSVPAEYEYLIRPLTKEHDLDYNPLIPYTGETYVDKIQTLRMGITKVIGIELVKEFIDKNKEFLLSKGYNFRDFFPGQTTRMKVTK